MSPPIPPTPFQLHHTILSPNTFSSSRSQPGPPHPRRPRAPARLAKLSDSSASALASFALLSDPRRRIPVIHRHPCSYCVPCSTAHVTSCHVRKICVVRGKGGCVGTSVGGEGIIGRVGRYITQYEGWNLRGGWRWCDEDHTHRIFVPFGSVSWVVAHCPRLGTVYPTPRLHSHTT